MEVAMSQLASAETTNDRCEGAVSGALGAIYADNAAWLVATIRRRYGAEFADDVVQETFVRVAAASGSDALRNPRAYLLQVAGNLAKNRLRDGKRRAAEPLDDRLQETTGVHASQLQAVIFRQIILALPQKLRDVFVLKHIRGQSLEEIAQLLGISVKTVEKRLKKARALCAAAMRD